MIDSEWAFFLVRKCKARLLCDVTRPLIPAVKCTRLLTPTTKTHRKQSHRIVYLPKDYNSLSLDEICNQTVIAAAMLTESQ